MTTVRFSKLVADAGTPKAHTLWGAPDQDHEFQLARKAHRVLTVQQHNTGTKADIGIVGYHEKPESVLLIFPKSLRKFEGCDVVGIKYDLLKEEQPSDAAVSRQKVAKKSAPKRRSKAKAPTQKFAALRLFTPPENGEGKNDESTRPETTTAENDQGALNELTGEVRKALKKLENGNAVAAYKILEKAIS